MKTGMRTNLIVGVICLIIGVVLGALSGTWTERRRSDERIAMAVEAESARAGHLEAEVSQLQKRLDLGELHLRLGRLAMEADHQDYGTAGEQAATFFDAVARMEEQAGGDEKVHAALEQILGARDEVTAGLATADPAATQRLKQLYLDFFDLAY